MENKNFWIGIVMVVLLISVTMIQFGNKLDDKNMLDNNSKSYLTNVGDNFEQYGLESATNDTQEPENPLLSKLENVPILSDVLGLTNFLIDATRGVFDFLRLLYNIPSFLIEGLGIPVGGFSTILNILGTIIGLGILLTLVRVIK